ncbi:hypothetical protein AFLA_000751 [Aspergillus flavus NRRL3357]|nr:hypothetical protein AFLA_000751 [Aspergillus flavus NRRL3357]
MLFKDSRVFAVTTKSLERSNLSSRSAFSLHIAGNALQTAVSSGIPSHAIFLVEATSRLNGIFSPNTYAGSDHFLQDSTQGYYPTSLEREGHQLQKPTPDPKEVPYRFGGPINDLRTQYRSSRDTCAICHIAFTGNNKRACGGHFIAYHRSNLYLSSSVYKFE